MGVHLIYWTSKICSAKSHLWSSICKYIICWIYSWISYILYTFCRRDCKLIYSNAVNLKWPESWRLYCIFWIVFSLLTSSFVSTWIQFNSSALLIRKPVLELCQYIWIFSVSQVDFLALEMRKGKVNFLWDVGSGVGRVEYPHLTIHDGNWHRIEASR